MQSETAQSPYAYQHGRLYCENVSLTDLVADTQTPVYVYSHSELLRRANIYQQAASRITSKHLVCYALKANGNPTLLQLLAQAGLGADVTSGGELYLAQKAGFPPSKILFSGVGKTVDELAFALKIGIRALHVESALELDLLAETAANMKKVAPISVRVNPDVQAATHPHISTGRRAHKFGVSGENALLLIRQAARHPWLDPVGLATHIGSQIMEIKPFDAAASVILGLADQLAEEGISLEYLDVGGGLGIDYDLPGAPDPEDWVSHMADRVVSAGYGLVMEPGRSIAGPAGLLLTRVLYIKEQAGKKFAVTDAGMTDLIRPALYGAYHPILPVEQPPEGSPISAVTIVGPVCETGDTLAHDRSLPSLKPGDLLAVMQAGAYGFAMSSNYNGRLKPAEALVRNRDYTLIRQRQTFQHLVQDCL